MSSLYSQTYQPNYLSPIQPSNSYLSQSSAFKQEIARVEINVLRKGKAPMSIVHVPRLEQNDVLKVRLLEEMVNGVKPDQSNYDWSFLVAFINPGRNNEEKSSVSEEIRFRKTGWYKEYSFVVPYDSQAIFFLYPKPNYRAKILNLVTKNQEEIRKIGEKTIELSGAYAKIGSFLNELQFVLQRNSYSGFGGFSSYGGYGGTSSFNRELFMQQTVERLARSFNIQLPSCWSGGYGLGGGSYGNNNYGNNNYGNNNYGNNNYGNFGGGYGNDFAGRVQCVAKNVRLEDFDLSVSRLLQQGGILAASQLAQKYPQIAHWINIAAIAIDLILKITKKSPLKIVPTVISTPENQGQNFAYQNSLSAGAYNSFSGNSSLPGANPNTVKISLFAESPPNDNSFVTAYPLVVHKWQAEADPEVISLPVPTLVEPCLHAGQNVLRSTDLMNDWMADTFTKDFKLIVSSPNGFRKEFPLRKNTGMNGWDLSVTKEELSAFPKISMTLESEIVGTRGFNEVKSPKFALPIAVPGTWDIEAESQKAFSVGGKRTVTLRNQAGDCRCLQAVVYKPSFGGQFVFEAGSKESPLVFSDDGKEVYFTIDTMNFQAGQGQMDLRQYGGEVSNLNITLHPLPPSVTGLQISRGDRQAVLTGDRLEQVRAVRINGKRAIMEGGYLAGNPASSPIAPANSNLMGNPMSYSQNAAIYGVSTGAPGEKVFVFEDPNARQDAAGITLELELQSGRLYKYPTAFNFSPARPMVVASDSREIEGVAIGTYASGLLTESDIARLPIFPISTSQISVNLQNALTDYDFKVENIQIETRIEKSEPGAGDLPKVSFEVLDWKNLRVSFLLAEQSQKLLGGRRLQFRIRDKIRGISDWYTLRKTFARIPENISVRCASEMKENCEIKGAGIEYIRQVSVDGGRTWFPREPAALVVQPTADGQSAAMIPRYTNKRLLQIRLKDFRTAEGLPVADYKFTSLLGGKR